MVYLFYVFIIHSTIKGHLGCFHFLAIVNSVVMDMVEQVYVL